MTSAEVTQIHVAGQRTGIIDLKRVIEEVARDFSERPDTEIADELILRLSKKNYIVTTARDDYKAAFLREYKKFKGQPYEETAYQGLLKIRVLGPGCPSCNRLEQVLMALLSELGIKSDLEHVRHPLEISRYGITAVPALVINGEVKAVGNVPSKAALKKILQDAWRHCR